MKLFISFILSICLLVISSCSSDKSDPKSKNKTAIVDVMIAGEVSFPDSVEVNGSVLADEMVELRPEVSGVLIYLFIPDGEFVNKGTLLARINNADLLAQLKQVTAQLDLAKKTENRLKSLFDVNGVSQTEYDAAINQVSILEANIDVINAQIAKTEIKAPFDGTLGLRQVSPGAYVSPSTIISTLQQTSKLKVDFVLPEAYLSLVKTGNIVNVIQLSSDKKMSAEIFAVEPSVNAATRNIKVRARLKETGIKPGTFVKVILSKNTHGIVVPTNSIIPDASSDQVVIIKNGKAVFVPVETGVRTPEVVEITKGLTEGDSVVVSGVLFVKPKSEVKVRNVKKTEDLFRENK